MHKPIPEATEIAKIEGLIPLGAAAHTDKRQVSPNATRR